ncbi:spore-associated protein A [Streptosporangium sp. CA-135522]|uniref:spore-associated protein A n=1 Tax=Streptosporangium sp. CA-135522 TaxID=3240072 RepID=UPI003D91959E
MGARGKLAALAVAVTVSSGLVATAAPASAAGPCGSGYNLVGTYDIAYESGTKTGTLEVRWNSSTGMNCALAYGYGDHYGAETSKWVEIRPSGSNSWDSDHGVYKYYAGPVYASARGRCIDIFALVSDATISLSNVHCG